MTSHNIDPSLIHNTVVTLVLDIAASRYSYYACSTNSGYTCVIYMFTIATSRIDMYTGLSCHETKLFVFLLCNPCMKNLDVLRLTMTYLGHPIL